MVMSKNWLIWLIAGCCATVVLTAMGVVTSHLIERDNKAIQQGADAYREERVRLAMWRLDTLAATIVGSEDARPVDRFLNLPQDVDVFSQVSANAVVNPLYNQAPDYANSYWNYNVNSNEVVSPQVYEAKFLEDNGIDTSYNIRNRGNFLQLENLLSQRVSNVDHKGSSQTDTNKKLTCIVANIQPQAGEVVQSVEQQFTKNSPKVVKDFSLSSINDTAQSKGRSAVLRKNAPEVQQELSKSDQGKRKQAIDRLSNSYASNGQWGNQQNTEQLQVAQSRSNWQQQSNAVEPPEVSPFRPVWVDDELMLVRRVAIADEENVQGVWLNAEEVKQALLDEIEDLLPQANLEPALQDVRALLRGDAPAGSLTRMLKLPFVLIPNETNVVAVSVPEVVRGPIGFAWGGTLFALLAGFFMLRSVIRMSERRASFVSSVTHELRTPLTTFRLYSEMLSTGLIRDEKAKQGYLDTLKNESERLTHLVENVLSYSRIERGSSRAKRVEISLADLLMRIEERLSNRAKEAGLNFSMQYSAEESEQRLHIDITAVEQIIFNLVDNASKYATGPDCGDQLELQASIERNWVNFALCDQGKGVSRGERRRLFKPFHKSAEQAAHSKPGVGLGLALCRRLAKAMGGNLKLRSSQNGACFVLRIPQNR